MNYSNIIVYATKTCPYCTMAADWLTNKKIAFTKVLVDEDQQAAADMVKKTGQMGVPVIDIDGQIIVGFRPDVFEKLING